MNDNKYFSLQECLSIATMFGKDEYWAIQHYITINHLEGKFIGMITALAQSQVERLVEQISHHNWLAYPADNFYDLVAKKKMKPETAKLLDLAQRYTMLDMPLDEIAEKLKGKTEEIPEPNPFYRLTAEKLKALGVKFKDE